MHYSIDLPREADKGHVANVANGIDVCPRMIGDNVKKTMLLAGPSWKSSFELDKTES